MTESQYLLVQLIAPPEAKEVQSNEAMCLNLSCLTVYPQATKRETGQKAKAQALRAMLRRYPESQAKTAEERSLLRSRSSTL